MSQKNNIPITDEIGIVATDVDIFTGFLGRLENPDQTLISEGRGKGLKLYDEVARDPHAESVLQTLYLSVSGLDWEVTAADESARAQEIADVVRAGLAAINLKQAMSELLKACLYGFYAAEIIWAADRTGAWVPARIIAKHPRRFCFTAERDLRLLTKTSPMAGEAVPERKFVVFTYGSSDNPYGEGMGQSLWWPVWFKKNGIKFWLIFLDKWGSPTTVGKYPAGSTPEQKKMLLAAIAAIRQETGVTIPEGMAINLLEASRSGNVTHESLCDYMDRQISKLVLGQTLTTEVGTSGSLAAGKVHNDVRVERRDALAGLLGETLSKGLVRWIVDYNFFGTDLYPAFALRTKEQEDLKTKADVDLIVIKDLGLPVAVDYFYDTYGYPRPEPGSVLIRPPVTGAASTESQFAEKSSMSADQQAIESLADMALHGTDLAANETAISEAISGAASFEAAVTNLLEIFPQLDMRSLQEMMGRVALNAELFGRQAAKDDNGSA